MVSSLKGTLVRGSLLILCCILAWLLGAMLAHKLSDTGEKVPETQLQQVDGQLRAPRPGHSRCGLMSPCGRGEFAFSVFSGAGTSRFPRVCFDDHMIMSRNRNNVGRGINIIGVNPVTGTVTHSRVFDMWEKDCADEMIAYLEGVADGTILFMATHDEASTHTNANVRAALKQLGSVHIDSLGFRDSWVFVGAKGHNLGRIYEQVVHKDETVHRVGDWPMEAQTEGCFAHRQ